MAGALRGLTTATVAVAEAWERALPPFGVLVRDEVSRQFREMDDAGLLALLDHVTEVGRRAESLTVALAGEIASRSPRGSGEALSQRSGFASPARQVAASTGGTVGRAAMMVAVGAATATRRALTGEELPAVHPHVAAVVQDGRVSVEAAHLVVRMLDGLPSTVEAGEVDRAEVMLAELATTSTLEELRGLVERVEALLDPDGVEPKEEVLRQGRSVTMTQDRAGRFLLRGVFDPETGAPIKAALDAAVESALRAARGHNHPGQGEDQAGSGEDGQAGSGDGGELGESGEAGRGVRSVIVETRTTSQIAADALADFARHVLACTDRVPGLPAVSVVVRMDLEDLAGREGGCRFAEIDGVDQPISAATARRLACTAGLIPAVLGSGSVPLDLGRAARLFSRAQFVALWERDRGCASCGQTTFVEAHHIVEWEHGGPTDLSNGVLLCSRCHHRVHRDDWEIRIQPDGVWFVPPPSIDPSRRPRPGIARPTPRET